MLLSVVSMGAIIRYEFSCSDELRVSRRQSIHWTFIGWVVSSYEIMFTTFESSLRVSCHARRKGKVREALITTRELFESGTVYGKTNFLSATTSELVCSRFRDWLMILSSVWSITFERHWVCFRNFRKHLLKVVCRARGVNGKFSVFRRSVIDPTWRVRPNLKTDNRIHEKCKQLQT